MSSATLDVSNDPLSYLTRFKAVKSCFLCEEYFLPFSQERSRYVIGLGATGN